MPKRKNFDSILTSGQTYKKQFTEEEKEAWVETQKQNRETANGIVENALPEISQNSEKLLQYLDTQTRFFSYSVRNAILIMQQRPDAVKLGDSSYWRKNGFYIQRREKNKPVLIVEPANAFVRDDGSVGQYYNAKEVYDITQTTARLDKSKPVKYEEAELLTALISGRKCDIEVLDEMADGVNAEYIPDDNCILVRSGMGAEDIFRALSKEMAHCEFSRLYDDYSYEIFDFHAKCVSYMTSKRYGIESSVPTLPESYKELDNGELLEELTAIREAANSIGGRTARTLELNRQEKSRENETR